MNKIAKNYLYNLSYQILILIVPLITTPYVSRVLGAKGVGIFSYTNSIVQYFILFGCVGLNLYGQREIAYVQHDKEKRNKTFWELVILRICTIAVSLILFYVLFVHKEQYRSIYAIMSTEIVASMVDISWFYEGIEDFKKIVVRNFIVKILGVLLVFIFVKKQEDIIWYVFIQAFTLLLGNLSMWTYVPKLISFFPVSSLEIRKHLKPTLAIFLPQIASSVYTILDKTMIGFITGIEEEVAYYEQAQKLVKLVMAIVTSLGTVMLPRIANLFKLNDYDRIKECIGLSFKFTCFLAFPMMFGLMGISYNFVPWFFGNGYEKVIPNMIVIAPVLLCIATSNIIGVQFLLPTGRQREYTLSIFAGCILNLALNGIFIPRYLSLGAAIGSVIAELGVTSVQIYFTRNEFSIKHIVKDNKCYIECSAIMFFPVYVLSKLLVPSFVNTIICVLVGGITYFLLLFAMKDATMLEVINKILKKDSG